MALRPRKAVTVDIVIVGGGVAGLWTLNRLRDLGLNAILLENNLLGGSQTMHSQGIIHGGAKYALNGIFNKSAQALTNMPKIWQDCLQGTGEIDLTNVDVLATKQFLWSTNALSAKLSNFFASKILRSHINTIPRENYSNIFNDTNFTGNLYSLNEPIINTHSLIQTLVQPYADYIYKINNVKFNNKSLLITSSSDISFEIKAQHYIFTAGSGNANLLQDISEAPKMQLRPLKMVAVKLDTPVELFGHCIEAQSSFNATPTLTITSHETVNNEIVWYLGGRIAESGVNKTETEQINSAKQELERCLPWLKVTGQWKTYSISRAEPQHPLGVKPENAFVKHNNSYTVAWPVKLALTPLMTNDIISNLSNLKPKNSNNLELLDQLQPPEIATPFWEQI